ncbi:hypothetical protein [Phycicoccus duodecadis]|nr:hypothetical protein [Phycicoccus duodecadis]
MNDISDRAAAQDLSRRGTQVTVTTPEVHVGQFQGRGGKYYETDAVRVRLKGVTGTVLLDGIPEPEEFHTTPVPTGWQAPTTRTGYTAPLHIVYQIRPDGSVHAMALTDMDNAATSRKPELSLLVAAAGFAAVLAGLVAGNNGTIRLLVGADQRT